MNQVFADVHSVVDAAIQLVPRASVVDSNQEGLLTGHDVQMIVEYFTQDRKESPTKISESQRCTKWNMKGCGRLD